MYPAHQLSRRSLLSLGAAAAGAIALAGCSPSQNGATGGPAAGGGDAVAVPTFRARTELAGLPGAVQPSNELAPIAFDKYPTTFASVAQKPGSGGEVTMFQLVWGTPPPGGADNDYGRAINDALGVTLAPTFTASDNYQQKLATMLAGGDLPDLSWVRPSDSPATSQAIDQGAFADLSELLSGDAVLDYPNLANIPTAAWSRSMFQGKLVGVPRPLWLMNNFAVMREDRVEEAGLSVTPSTPDELFELQTALSTDGNWAYGWIETIKLAAQSSVHSMFGVPNGWRVESDGTFTNFVESDELEQALDYLVRSWKAGHYHPDAMLNQTQAATQLELFQRGSTGIFPTAVVAWFGKTGQLNGLLDIDPEARTTPLFVPGNEGADPTYYQTPGWYGMAAVSAAAGKDPERLKELLRVLDFFASPFGSDEYTLINYGVEGRHFDYDSSGTPIVTSDAQVASELAGNYFIQPSEVTLFLAGAGDRVAPAQNLLSDRLAMSIPDPSLGLYSQTLTEEAGAIGELNNSFHTDIIAGRTSLADGLAEWRETWASRGGQQIREELQESYATANG